jgi:hypothetical protein
MRIYDGDFTVGRLMEQCRIEPRRTSNLPVPGREPKGEIDIAMLNRCLSELPVAEIRRRRRRMNTFYEEVLVSSDPDRGIQFSSLLMILAHHKVINDNKSLRYVGFRFNHMISSADSTTDWRNSFVVALACNVSTKLYVATLLSASSIRFIGLVDSAAPRSKRARVVWSRFRNSLFQRFSSTTRTLPTQSVLRTIRLVVARCLHPPTRIRRVVWLV